MLTSPISFLQKAVPVDAVDGQPIAAPSLLRPNSPTSWRCGAASDDDMAGLDLGARPTSFVTGAERVHAATLRRFYERFAKFNLPDTGSARGLWAR